MGPIAFGQCRHGDDRSTTTHYVTAEGCKRTAHGANVIHQDIGMIEVNPT